MKKETKNYLKFGILLFGISLLLWNCDKENFYQEDSYFKTVSIQESLKFLQSEVNLKNKNTNTLSLDIDFDNAIHENLINSNEKITVIPATTQYKNIYTRVVLMRINGDIKSMVVNMMPSDSTKLFTGRIGITNLNGQFIIGYRVNNGVLISKLVKSQKTTTMHRKGQGELCDYHANGDPNCMFTDTVLDEVVITVQSNEQGIDPFDEGGSDYEDDLSNPEWNFGDGNPNGGNNNNTSDNCPGIKVLNPVTSICECPSGYDEDASGKCVKTPCVGDPVKDPEVAPQTNSGIKGGMFGKTRTNGTQWHKGLDLKNSFGAPIYALYSGTGKLVTQYDIKTGKIVEGAGHYIEITSTINGKTVKILYFHMQQNNRKSGTINAGDIIGYQGDSGNLKNAISQGLSVSHLHIKVKENGKSVDPIPYLKTKIDPNTGQVTNPCN